MPLSKCVDNKGFIDSLVVSDSGIEFNANVFSTMSGPGVFAFFAGLTPLYIGVGKSVLHRATSRSRHHVRARREATSVKLWACRSMKAARKLQALLIDRMRPKYNRRGSAWAEG